MTSKELSVSALGPFKIFVGCFFKLIEVCQLLCYKNGSSDSREKKASSITLYTHLQALRAVICCTVLQASECSLSRITDSIKSRFFKLSPHYKLMHYSGIRPEPIVFSVKQINTEQIGSPQTYFSHHTSHKTEYMCMSPCPRKTVYQSSLAHEVKPVPKSCPLLSALWHLSPSVFVPVRPRQQTWS